MKVLVVGAGIAGLGAASYFSARGHDVEVLEAGDRAGGRAVTLHRPGSPDRVDAGSQYYHSNYQRALRLIEQTGLKPRLSKVRGYTRIYHDSQRGGSFLYNRKLPWYWSTGIPGNLRLGLCLAETLLRYPKEPYILRPETAADNINAVLANRSRVVLDSIIRPLAQVGALSEPDVMDLSQLQLYRLIRIVLFTDYMSLDEGTSSLHEALAARLHISYGTPVKHLAVEGKGIKGVVLEGSNTTMTADHIVIATTPLVAARLLPDEWQDEKGFLSSIRIPSFALPSFFLDRPLDRRVWSYLLHQRGGRISYLTDAASKNPAMVPSGNSVIQPWVCYPHSAEFEAMDDDAVTRYCIDEIEDVFPGFESWIEHVHITRHPFGVPFHSTGHSARARGFLEQADRRGISFCGDYFSGGYMESALWSAERAAKVFG